MMPIFKTGQPVAARHPLFFALIVAIAGGFALTFHDLRSQPLGATAQGAHDAQAWAAVAASGDAGKFVASNYRGAPKRVVPAMS